MNKLSLMVCPHDTAKNPERWYEFAVFLSHGLNEVVHFDTAVDFADFHSKMERSNLIYANPQDSVRLARSHGFIPIARASNLFDEVVFIASNNVSNPDLGSISGKDVASVCSMLPTQIALNLLSKKGIKPASVSNKPSWMTVLSSIYKDEFQFGFLYKDFYDGLNDLSQSTVQLIDHSNEQQAFHMIMLNPKAREIQDALSTILMKMGETAKGQQILNDLNVEHWCPVTDSEFDRISSLTEQ